MSISKETTLTLRALNIRKDRKHYIVEDVESGDFYEMPEICIEAIHMMNDRQDLEKIEEQLIERFPDEDVDVPGFVEQLLDLGLISEMNGEQIERQIESDVRSGFKWIPERVGRFFFNRYSSKLYFGFFMASVLMMFLRPELFPRYKDLFVFDLMMGNIALWLFITFLLVLVHEFGHVLAVRSEKLPARIGIGHRLFLVVLETDMTTAWSLPLEKRNKLFLAGMSFDSVMLFCALTGQILIHESTLFHGILRLVVLDTFIRMLYQSGVYMKTDLYYVLENSTGSYNLMENGRHLISRWIPFLKEEHTETFKGEEKIVRTYALFYIAGIISTLFIFFFYYVPQLLFAIERVAPGLKEPVNSVPFWDSFVFYLQLALISGLLLYSWGKQYKEHN